ncbi:L-fucose dehydrogenase [Pedobacter nanyangensis]|uniref:SDR family oxidoreductase n=1 Tax=Pedobacter nanyangensis TaxID=1562389 RepID=UPI000DE3618F|nr:SDR family oxidoreductase [Pedobacter nanyangensis]
MDLQLKDKVVLVSGGAKGIGEAIVRSLASEGAIPVIIGRNPIDNYKLEKEITQTGGKCSSIVAELSNPAECEKVVSEAVNIYGKIDGLVNNAGLNDGVGLESGNYESFMQSVHNNLVHYYLLAHYALPYLKKTKGSIVNISSKTGVTGQGETSGYAASNGGRNALTREWAVELLKYQIRVNAVVVAECWTPQYERWIQTLPNAEETLAEINSRVPLENRMTKPSEIADTVAFLLSEKSSHTTGQLLFVDGGYVHLDRALLRQ